MNTKNKKSFTIMEVIVVIVVIGVLAGLAVPNISRMDYMSDFDAALDDLNLIIGAQMQHYAKYDVFYPAPAQDSTWFTVSGQLNLNITTNTVTYDCADTGDVFTFTCSATRINTPSFTITVNEGSTTTLVEELDPEVCEGGCTAG